MKLFTAANNQAESYDDVDGSKLNVKEALTKSYENITSLEERFSILQMDNDKALMILNAKDREIPMQHRPDCNSDSRRYLEVHSDIEFNSEKSDYKSCAGNSKELFEMDQMRMGGNANGMYQSSVRLHGRLRCQKLNSSFSRRELIYRIPIHKYVYYCKLNQVRSWNLGLFHVDDILFVKPSCSQMCLIRRA